MNRSRDSQIQAYLDGLMTAEETAAFEVELGRNPALAAQLAEWQSLFAELDALPEASFELAHDFAPAVMARIDAQTALTPRTRWLSLLQLGLAAIALVSSWPLLVRLFATLQLWLPDLDAQTGLVRSWLQAQQIRWMGVVDWLAGQIDGLWLEQPFSQLDLPLTPLLIGAGLAALLWIVTNAYLWRTWSDKHIDRLAS